MSAMSMYTLEGGCCVGVNVKKLCFKRIVGESVRNCGFTWEKRVQNYQYYSVVY
jgi:hypothetical protein